jgi:dihydrodipicolinate synthase/N-acetylneuraminate lyase
MGAHWSFLSQWVKGLLVPGSTGDGWELSELESQELLGLALDQVRRLKLYLLIGALRPAVTEAQRAIAEGRSIVQARTGSAAAEAALAEARVCGFAVCPPRGRELTQEQIEAGLANLLGVGLPMALYQLPQVTQNEMSPEVLARLAREHPNFLLFKDTSGTDRVASSGLDLPGVVLVRGAEGKYAASLKKGGGRYDGFLLSTANSFCRQLHQIIEGLSTGRQAEAQRQSDRLSRVVEEVFGLVQGLPDGNPFANAGKAVDHYFAFGPKGTEVAPPRLHSGRKLPVETIRETGRILERNELMPRKGYLE